MLNWSMSTSDPTGTNWTEQEIDLIIADYFEMLRMELSNVPFVKSHRNTTLQEHTGRSHGSVEYKHQNISAVLERLSMPWIEGYKPMANFQASLIDGVERYLLRPEFKLSAPVRAAPMGFEDQSALLFELPPQLTPASTQEPEFLQRLVRKFDPAKQDARNRALGKQGEERIFLSEQIRLRAANRYNLAKKVRWVSEVEGDGAGYDILSFDISGEERLLEVKTTLGQQTTPFYLSENERALSCEKPEIFGTYIRV